MLFRADELFQISVDPNAVFPLNLEFIIKDSNKKEMQGSGIYFMTYKDELIYIGYADRQEALDRMNRQLETITLRGSRIEFNERSENTILNSVVLRPFFNYEMLGKRNGYVTSQRRVLFAENHWKDFAFLDDCMLKNFAFDWFPIEKEIKEKCKTLKKKFRPRCNEEGFLHGDFERFVKI
jgi:hypothetical protein